MVTHIRAKKKKKGSTTAVAVVGLKRQAGLTNVGWRGALLAKIHQVGKIEIWIGLVLDWFLTHRRGCKIRKPYETRMCCRYDEFSCLFSENSEERLNSSDLSTSFKPLKRRLLETSPSLVTLFSLDRQKQTFGKVDADSRATYLLISVLGFFPYLSRSDHRYCGTKRMSRMDNDYFRCRAKMFVKVDMFFICFKIKTHLCGRSPKHISRAT